MTLADAIAPSSSDLQLYFPGEHVVRSYGEVWDAGVAAAGRLRARVGGAPVAIALTNSLACVTLLVGSIAAGLPVVSVPTPPRGVDSDWYSAFIERVCAMAGAGVLVSDPAIMRSVPALAPVDRLTFDEVLGLEGSPDLRPASFSLTQFTSGSTSDPRGVVLTGELIRANLAAMVDWLDPRPGDGISSWLPLSHDMGLIGTVLATLAAAASLGPARTHLVLLTPRAFIRNPVSWLQALEDYGSTFTAAPASGFELAARMARRPFELGRLRTCIVGGEPVSPSALELFSAKMAAGGFDASAFCPSYGMAEAVLAVTGQHAAREFRVASLADLAPGRYAMASGDPDHPIVSCGSPLNGYEVVVDGVGPGEILVRGPSLAERDASGARLLDEDGWLHTRDLGVLRNGELYVLGRMDDVFQVAGRNIYALDLESHASEVSGIMPGRALALPDGDGIVVVAECEQSASSEQDVRRIALGIRQVIAGRLGVSPRRILLTRRGSLPLTASGKVRRRPLAAALSAGSITALPGSIF